MIDEKFIRETFLNLVAIDSPSGHEKGVSDFILKHLQEAGVKVSKDANGNLIGKIAGTGKPLILSAHMDTVEPGRSIKAIAGKDVIRSTGDTILGADDKAGITEILSVLKTLRESKKQHRSLEIIFTVEEETGIKGVSKLDLKKIASEEALVVDASGLAETIVTASPFIFVMDVEIRGRAAHAGNSPEKGINSIQVAADAIRSLKLGRIDSETTNNIGIIRGGEIRNGVPALTLIHAEARSHKLEKAKREVEKYKQAFEKSVKKHDAKIKFKVSLACSGFKYSENDEFVRSLSREWTKMKKKPHFKKAGGASDANGFAAKGIKAVPIGYGGKNPHAVNESIRVSDMKKIAQFITNFIINTSK